MNDPATHSSAHGAVGSGVSDPFGLIGTTLGEKYSVERVLGEGGAGVVYGGKHLSLGEQVAVKCLKPVAGLTSGEAQATEQFLREARVLFSLTHPSIVRLYDAGAVTTRLGSVPYVVLELVDGVPLDREIAQRAREGRPFTIGEILAVFEPVLSAIAFAHQRGVCHRDLKPSNVMLVRTPAGGVTAKVLDFGTARAGVQDVSVGTTGFTPRYAAPEQWDKNYGTTGPASDIFSLGLVLAEVCALEPAFAGDSPGQILAQVLNPAVAISVRSRRPDLPEAVEYVVRRATERAAPGRYASAQEMLDALRAAAAASPSQATVSGAWNANAAAAANAAASYSAPYGVVTTGARPATMGPKPESGSGILVAGAIVAAVLVLGGLAVGGYLFLARPGADTRRVSSSPATASDPGPSPASPTTHDGEGAPPAAFGAPSGANASAIAVPLSSAAFPAASGALHAAPGASHAAVAGVASAASPTASATGASSAAASSAKHSMTVSLRLDKPHVKPGATVGIAFSAPLDPSGARYWVTLVPATLADNLWSNEWHYVDPGLTRTTLTAPSSAGAMEVRLHDRYSEFTTHVIARSKLSVDAP